MPHPRKSNPPPTQREIALKLGVSQNTVSLALAGSQRVSAATRQRIQAAALGMGYRPDSDLAAAMARVRRGRTTAYQGTLGVILTGGTRAILDHSGVQACMAGIRERAAQLGYQVEPHLIDVDYLGHRSRLRQIVESRGFKGVIFYEPTYTFEMHAEAATPFTESFGRLPSALISLFSYARGTSLHIGQDLGDAARTSVQHAISLGYRRPWLVRSVIYTTDEFVGGFLQTQQGLPEPDRLQPLLLQEIMHADSWKQVDHGLRTLRPDCVLTNEWKLREALIAAGWSIPRDFGLIIDSLSAETPDWAGVEGIPALQGSAAVDGVVAQIQRKSAGLAEVPTRLLVRGGWREGATLPKRTQRPPSWDKPYPDTLAAPATDFIPIDLSAQYNRPLRQKWGWLGELPLFIEAGIQQIHGVPFIIADKGVPGDQGAIVLNSAAPIKHRGGPLPDTVEIPLRRKAAALYFLHGCGWTDPVKPFARYRMVFEDDREETVSLCPYAYAQDRLHADPNRLERANIQDWWWNFLHKDHEHSRFAVIGDEGGQEDSRRYVYTLHWPNPRPQIAIKRVLLEAIPGARARLGLIALTLRKPTTKKAPRRTLRTAGALMDS